MRPAPAAAQAPPESRTIESILRAYPDKFEPILARPEEFRAQVLLAEVRPDEQGKPRLVRRRWRVDAEYFYPASTVKLLSTVAALQTLHRLRKETGLDLTIDTPLAWHPLFADDVLEDRDETNIAGPTAGRFTIRQEIRKIYLVSDNASHNRLFELVGHRPMNEMMWDAGLKSVRIHHRLDEVRSVEDNRRSPRIELLDASGAVLHTLPERTSDLIIDNAGVPGIAVGTGEMIDDKIVPGPKSFLYKNRVSLVDLQDAIIKVVRPDIDLGTPAFDLTDDERAMLLEAMSQYPRESKNPVYKESEFSDYSGKFFLRGLERVLPRERLRIFNKTGEAWGFLLDNAYVVDTQSGRGFFLAAVIYANADGILGDDNYELDTVSYSFLANVAEVISRELWGP